MAPTKSYNAKVSALTKLSATKVTNGESGSCFKPATAVYKSRTPSLSTLASLKRSMSSTLSLNRDSRSPGSTDGFAR